MTIEEAKKRFHEIGIIPVVAIDNAKDAAPLGEALLKGGLPAAEVTFRTDAAEETIRIMARNFPDMLVGAGTVLTTEQADRAIAAGAKFIVSPGLNPEVVKYVQSRGVPMTPGIATASEIEQAISLGLDFVKFFPAEAMGGLKTIKALAGPYNHMVFMPTGGVNTANVEEYLSYEKIVCCGGTWMVKGDLINGGKFDEIEKICEDAAAVVQKIHSKM